MDGSRTAKGAPPVDRQRIIDLYFLEHRAKLIDIAAFLDRVERASNPGGKDDVRLVAFREAIRLLDDNKPHRAKRVLDLLSDPTTEPIPAAGTKGATGVWPGFAAASTTR